MHFTAIKSKWEPKDFLFSWWCQAVRGWTQTHTHTHTLIWPRVTHLSRQMTSHPSVTGWNISIQFKHSAPPKSLSLSLSLSLFLTPYGQSQGALLWDRWPMATTLTQSRVKPRNKTGRLVWFGPIKAFRVSRICKEEIERGYGLGKVKNISHWTSPRRVIYFHFYAMAFQLYTKLNVHTLWLRINVFCNFKHYFFLKKTRQC